MNASTRLALLGLTLALAGCSVLEGDKVDYKSASAAPSLAIPPDLTQLSRDNRYAIPGGPVTALTYQSGAAAATSVPVAAIMPAAAWARMSAPSRAASGPTGPNVEPVPKTMRGLRAESTS